MAGEAAETVAAAQTYLHREVVVDNTVIDEEIEFLTGQIETLPAEATGSLSERIAELEARKSENVEVVNTSELARLQNEVFEDKILGKILEGVEGVAPKDIAGSTNEERIRMAELFAKNAKKEAPAAPASGEGEETPPVAEGAAPAEGNPPPTPEQLAAHGIVMDSGGSAAAGGMAGEGDFVKGVNEGDLQGTIGKMTDFFKKAVGREAE